MSMSNFNVLILCAIDKFEGDYPPVLSDLIEALITQYSLLPSPSTPVEIYYAGSDLTQDKSKKKCSAYLQANFPELCGYKPEMFDMVLLDHCPLTNDKTVMSPYLLDKIKYLLKPSGLLLLKNDGLPYHIILPNPIPDNKTATLHDDNLKAYSKSVTGKGHATLPLIAFLTFLAQKGLLYHDNISGYVDYATGPNKNVNWVIFKKTQATHQTPAWIKLKLAQSVRPQLPPVTANFDEEQDPDKIMFIQLA